MRHCGRCGSSNVEFLHDHFYGVVLCRDCEGVPVDWSALWGRIPRGARVAVFCLVYGFGAILASPFGTRQHLITVTIGAALQMCGLAMLALRGVR